MEEDMEKIKVITIFGTRPEAIKMAPLIKELQKNESIESKVCVTAQHREMLDQVLKLFEIVPDFDLNIMQSKQTLTGITNRVSIRAKSNPPTTTIPRGTRLCAPAPMAKAIGSAPNIVANEVIRMGRRRDAAASNAASPIFNPASRF